MSYKQQESFFEGLEGKIPKHHSRLWQNCFSGQLTYTCDNKQNGFDVYGTLLVKLGTSSRHVLPGPTDSGMGCLV